MVSINSISLDSKLSSDRLFNRFCFVKVFSFKTYSDYYLTQPLQFLKISQNSQHNICVRLSFLLKLQTWRLQLSLKESKSLSKSLNVCLSCTEWGLEEKNDENGEMEVGIRGTWRTETGMWGVRRILWNRVGIRRNWAGMWV